jgi:hypothetical protein
MLRDEDDHVRDVMSADIGNSALILMYIVIYMFSCSLNVCRNLRSCN